MKARVCEQWDIELPERTPGDPWYLDWIDHVSKGRTASWLCYQALHDLGIKADSAIEYFGGIGAQSLMIQELWQPTVHTVFEYSVAGAAHLAHTLPPAVEVHQADSYNPRNTRPAALVGLDYGDLTVWKTQEKFDQGKLLERVFLLEPNGVVITDVAARFMHLHRQRYESLLGDGTCGSYKSYLYALARYVEKRWGYAIVTGYYDKRVALLAFAKEEVLGQWRGKIAQVPESPVGLVLL